MPYNTKEKTRAFRKRWWAGLSKERKLEKRIKANLRSKKVKEFLANYKLAKKCMDCGYDKHHSALEFDHVKGKKHFNVCFASSITQARKEMLKCEVVCSNCHRIRTYNRLYPVKTYEEV